jgi:hypothetical protein
MAGATAPAFFFGLVLERPRGLRFEPIGRDKSTGAIVCMLSCWSAGYRRNKSDPAKSL